ncbi:MAG: UDP-3-O-(3-hydroxymyristoyl)glucosamine N-acyltransferase [Rhodobacteraceae bacterium]|nr:UDP-3-O-(3-hydroxymyristoyl)glucosamine N-acyltransferase [Paracoccaceae bacterium]
MAYTVSELAHALEAEAAGDLSLLLNSPNQPELAGSDQIALAMDPAFADRIKQGSAQVALLWQGADWQSYGLKAAIFVKRARFAMSGITGLFEKHPAAPVGIHPSAIISTNAIIGENASIGAFVIIEDDVKIGKNARILSHGSIGAETRIGDDCLLYQGVRLGARITIGNRFIAQPNAVIGSDGFSFVSPETGIVDAARAGQQPKSIAQADSYARINSLGGVTIGDNVEIGAGAAIDRGTIIDTFIGDGTKIDNLVQIAHNVKLGKNCLICAQVGIGGSAVIGNGTVLAGQVGVADNITVGKNVVAAGKSGISSNVPANRFIMGNPAIKMDANVASYKAYRRLPKLVEKVENLQKQVSKIAPKD